MLILSAIIFLAYTVTTSILFGIPASLSDTYYHLADRSRLAGQAFTFALFAAVILMLPAWLEHTGENLQFIAFLSAAGLAFVAAAAAFKERETNPVHVIGAIICALCSQLWVVLATPYWRVSVICFFMALSLSLFRPKSKVFWVEMACFVSTYTALFAVL